MKKLHNNQDGIAHIGLIVLAVVIIGAIGFTAYRISSKKDASDSLATTNPALSEAAKAECEKHNDKDLCKFFTSWKANEKYRMSSTDPSGAKSVFEVDGNKSHVAMTGETSYEVITIDKTTYTKAGDVWYKQTITKPDQDVSSDYKVDFEDPDDESTSEEDKTTYKAMGKESCGNLTCFKYEIIDPENTDEKNYIWFDDKDYQLRRSLTEGPDGTSDTTFEYDNVSISEPSPVKELGPNEYIMPGQTEPMTLPTASDYGQ